MQINSHLSVLIHDLANKYGDKPALTFKKFGGDQWQTVSWNQFSLRVKQVSNALLNIGAKPQDKIAVFSQNCVHYLYTDFGAYGVRVCSIPFYATSSEQQIQYMINDGQVRFLFVGEQEQYDKAHRVFALCPSLERIIIFDSSVRISTHDPNALYFKDFVKLGENLPRQTEVEELYKQASMDDLANILYTSGTTGDSKGVMLTYGQYHAALKANNECVPVSEKDRVINFLPFTHIFERGWAYLSLSEGARLFINTYPHEIQESMREVHPTCMSSVPRFWEKVYIAVKAKMDNASAFQKKLFNHALAVGRKRNIEYLANGKRPPLTLELEYKLINKTVLSMVRKQLGLENPNIFPTAGAYVSPEVEKFIHSIGIGMVVGYGLTESLATVLWLVACLGVLDKNFLFLAGIRVGVPITKANTRLHLVDVLTTRTTGTEGIPRQLGWIDIHLDGIIHQWGDEDTGETGHTLALGIERRYTHQAMHTVLTLQVTVCVLTALDGHGHTLDTSLIAFLHHNNRHHS